MKPNFEQWVKKDRKLNDLLVEIQSTDSPPFEQAELAFDKLCALYNLPKMPEDLAQFEAYYERKGIDAPRSVYEEAALLKFLEPHDDPRGVIVLAVFHVKNDIGVDLKDVFAQAPDKLPEIPRLGIRGEGLDTEIIFIKDNENWFDLGCKVMMQLS